MTLWTPEDIHVEFDIVEHPEVIAAIRTPAGEIHVAGALSIVGRIAYIDQAHVQGLSPGVFGIAGLHAIARKILMELDVDQIVIAGAIRSTGRRIGRLPRPFRFPHST